MFCINAIVVMHDDLSGGDREQAALQGAGQVGGHLTSLIRLQVQVEDGKVVKHEDWVVSSFVVFVYV